MPKGGWIKALWSPYLTTRAIPTVDIDLLVLLFHLQKADQNTDTQKSTSNQEVHARTVSSYFFFIYMQEAKSLWSGLADGQTGPLG